MATLAFFFAPENFWGGFFGGALCGFLIFGLPLILRKRRSAAKK